MGSCNENESELEYMRQNFVECQEHYKALKERYDELEKSYNELEESYNQLNYSYDELNCGYGDLEDRYDELKKSYDELEESKMNNVEKCVKIVTNLYDVFFDGCPVKYEEYKATDDEYKIYMPGFNSTIKFFWDMKCVYVYFHSEDYPSNSKRGTFLHDIGFEYDERDNSLLCLRGVMCDEFLLYRGEKLNEKSFRKVYESIIIYKKHIYQLMKFMEEKIYNE